MCCCDSLYSLEYGIIDSLNLYRISSNVHIENDSWAPYVSVILGAVLTFLLNYLINKINECRQRKKEKIQLLNQIREKILDADKYAEEFLQTQMQAAGLESYVNVFGKKVSALEFLFEMKRLMLDDSICNKINLIKEDMFQYQFLAMKCTVYSGIANSNPGDIMAWYSQQASNVANDCDTLLNKWQNNLGKLENEMKEIMKKL